MAATKYKGKDLSFLVNGVEQKMEITSCVLQPEEGDAENVTFGEVGSGNAATWFAQITAIADYGASSFWTYCWDNNGTEQAYVLKPYGNATASATQPHFTGKVRVATPPQIGGEAGTNFTFEIRLDCDARPTRKIS